MEITAGPEAEAVRAAEEAFSREQAAGGASVLTVAALEAHERATGGGAGVGRERRMFVCEVHGPFFKRVDALKPVARCFGVPGTKPCGRGRLDPVPREEERGEGLFECGQCGQKWADMLARWDVCQPCPGEKEGEGEDNGVLVLTLLAPCPFAPEEEKEGKVKDDLALLAITLLTLALLLTLVWYVDFPGHVGHTANLLWFSHTRAGMLPSYHIASC